MSQWWAIMHLFTFTERCLDLQSEVEKSQSLRLARESAALKSELVTHWVNVWVIYFFIVYRTVSGLVTVRGGQDV